MILCQISSMEFQCYCIEWCTCNVSNIMKVYNKWFRLKTSGLTVFFFLMTNMPLKKEKQGDTLTHNFQVISSIIAIVMTSFSHWRAFYILHRNFSSTFSSLSVYMTICKNLSFSSTSNIKAMYRFYWLPDNRITFELGRNSNHLYFTIRWGHFKVVCTKICHYINISCKIKRFSSTKT